jgi:hypothetical protein
MKEFRAGGKKALNKAGQTGRKAKLIAHACLQIFAAHRAFVWPKSLPPSCALILSMLVEDHGQVQWIVVKDVEDLAFASALVRSDPPHMQSTAYEAVCGVQEYAECAAPPPFGEAAHEFLAPHILWGPEGGQEFIDRAEVAAAKMRVRHRFDGFQLLGWVCFQVHFRGLHLCVPEP